MEKSDEQMKRQDLLDASCRVALAALMHDLGKFAERARIETDRERLESHVSLYCPYREQGGYHTHKHAAYTALAWDLIEQRFPELTGRDVYPFAAWNAPDVDDSIVNAAALHHRPETFLQWIVATADRVASGFERERFETYNQAQDKSAEGRTHYTARLLTLFEQIDLQKGQKAPQRGELAWRYPLLPLSPKSIFPVEAGRYEPADNEQGQQEYRQLWDAFIESLDKIPDEHRKYWHLWLDHFDSAWGCYTHAIPSATAFGTRPEVSLYDHSRAVAALAVALWRYHHDQQDDPETVRQRLADFRRPDWDDRKFLLIQGDFFGIQEFLFASGGETQKRAARLLRGRSFYVSLLTECAALAILDALALPSTSQVINAAGKFLIVAPNTTGTREALESIRQRFDTWFLEHSWGQAGIGLAWTPASCNDFLDDETNGGRSRFGKLMDRLFQALADAKARRFDLCGNTPPAPVFDDFLDRFRNDLGVCAIDGRSPATMRLDGAVPVSALAADQIAIGKYLAHRHLILISREPMEKDGLQVPIFGFRVAFARADSMQTPDVDLLRAWDFSLPDTVDAPLFNGLARRNINGYVPLFGDPEEWDKDRYKGLDEAAEERHPDEPKTFEYIARDDRILDERGKWIGVEGLSTLKGDVDNLGAIFERGLARPTFAKMAALSRQMNNFFAVWLPCKCRQCYPSTYTVFAGGDDFFLIGPWLSTMRLANEMRLEFERYVAGNPQIHFSAGLSMTKPGIPIRYLGDLAEQALEHSKERRDEHGRIIKDGVTCFGYTVGWEDFGALIENAAQLDAKRKELDLSTGYLYGLQQLAEDAGNLRSDRPRLESALWRSRFAYRTARMLERQRGLDREARRRLQEELGTLLVGAMERYGAAWKIALFTHLYQHRN
ncbi:type III-A CRISPR-associated protein Cas10/Csm1 [Candidatus Parcubacteria bacterium]|nr:MAG: type III-A CRISPR-associated protein Cas10/Csm1 [Candidatus Parcubacteria bacterium]